MRNYTVLHKAAGLIVLVFAMYLALPPAVSRADTNYTIRKGDSLYRISNKFGTDIETIRAVNGLRSDKLVPGKELLIPSGSAMEPSPTHYKVKRGDSLWSISRRFDISVDELKALNGQSSDRLTPGQELLIAEVPHEEEHIRNSEATLTVIPGPDRAVPGEDANTGAATEANEKMRDFLAYITKQTLGIPYKFGANSPKSTDCSGYVQRVFSFLGMRLPRSAREQYKVGAEVEKDKLSVGDLVFFRTYAPFPSHVGIYLGDNLFVHASALARKVTIDNLNTPYYIKRFIGAKRLPLTGDVQVSDAAEPPAGFK